MLEETTEVGRAGNWLLGSSFPFQTAFDRCSGLELWTLSVLFATVSLELDQGLAQEAHTRYGIAEKVASKSTWVSSIWRLAYSTLASFGWQPLLPPAPASWSAFAKWSRCFRSGTLS